MFVEKYKYTRRHASSYRPPILCAMPAIINLGLRSESAYNINFVFHTVLTLSIINSLVVTLGQTSNYNLVFHIVVMHGHATNESRTTMWEEVE